MHVCVDVRTHMHTCGLWSLLRCLLMLMRDCRVYQVQDINITPPGVQRVAHWAQHLLTLA